MIEINPAYGRKYKNIDEALIDWNRGKDFIIFNGPYCSKRNLDLMIKEYGKVVLVINDKRHVLGQDLWGSII